MNAFLSQATAGAHNALYQLPAAAWDLNSFLKNGANLIKTSGGYLLVAMGLAALVWGGILLLKKLMSGQQNQDSWVKIIMLMIVGGAISTGGFVLIMEIGGGGEGTIKELGKSTILWDAALPLGTLFGLG